MANPFVPPNIFSDGSGATADTFLGPLSSSTPARARIDAGDNSMQDSDGNGMHTIHTSDSAVDVDMVDATNGDTDGTATATDQNDRIGGATLADHDTGPAPFRINQGIYHTMGQGGLSEESTPGIRNGGGSQSMANDLVHRITGLYRILDLISEQGSGGLVDKVVIAQEHLGRLMNDLSPGVYSSMTKVDFNAFDKVSLRPRGIYGSKSEIVRFLLSMSAVDTETARLLLKPQGLIETLSPILRSGLYALRLLNSAEEGQTLYVIYWPEDTTWKSTITSSVLRNRVTFMRYLTKIADQIACLISDEDERDVVWKEEIEHAETEDEDEDSDEDSDRLFAFEVFKTNEQEENVVSRTGFSIEFPTTTPLELDASVEADRGRLQPRLIPGETAQAILQVSYIPARQQRCPLAGDHMSPIRLKDMIERGSLLLNESMTSETLALLLKNGLATRAPDAYQSYRKSMEALDVEIVANRKAKVIQMTKALDADAVALGEAIRSVGLDRVWRRYPILNARHSSANHATTTDYNEFLQQRLALYPDIREHLKDLDNLKVYNITATPFKLQKERILMCDIILNQYPQLEIEQQSELIDAICDASRSKTTANLLSELRNSKPKSQGSGPGLIERVWSYLTISDASMRQLTDAQTAAASMSNDVFLSSLDGLVTRHPLLEDRVQGVSAKFQEHLEHKLNKQVEDVVKKVRRVQERACMRQIDLEADAEKERAADGIRARLKTEVKDALLRPDAPHTVYLESVQSKKVGWFQETFTVKGEHRNLVHPMLRYAIYPLAFTEDDKQRMQLNDKYVPTPRIHARSRSIFDLPLDHNVLHIQLLQNHKCLLILDDSTGNVKVFLESLTTIDGALKRSNACKKVLKRDKIGAHFLLAFDETKRMLVVLSTSEQLEPRLQLHMFSFDETFTSLQGMGTPMNLGAWYDRTTSVVQMSFVCGSEELVLLDDCPRARIFSFVTQQFRPATLPLQRIPFAICSSPDGSCLLTLDSVDDGCSLHAYHWATFGTTKGISIDLEEPLSMDSFILTSIGGRSKIHFVVMNLDENSCHSIALDITRKVTEFMFKQTGRNGLQARRDARAAQNYFIDCHSEVWTRFPVVPAIRRQTVSSDHRKPKSLTFVTSRAHSAYARYFSDLVSNFEQSTRKPTGTELSTIVVGALDYDSFVELVLSNEDLTAFKGGEWVVDLLCLIPIHLAIARDNRFVPLKDGVWSSELERSLLGADVGRIVDTLSFGWYESLFQSYMATKPVKVVSSMGEQSVGKSFALNHLVDTSFAGSAMRTTEGVWMSVTPLHDMIIVALDFEGVHSIERSAQEDTLLVLFNTAISNLVLFRNNFALSRDITGLFKSFQSSSSILDPDTNPDLFQSTLAIIIKDVVESDKTEIIKEFSLKFQHIVQLEQGSNFITRLHRGRLDIVPWPVIESRQFYTLFSAFKRRLDKQNTAYSGGSVFLQIIKTVMAKLKANDWGALSQNLVIHRAQLLQSVLPKALMFGAAEVEPDYEPLKNYDTGEVVEYQDAAHRFFLDETGSSEPGAEHVRAGILANLIHQWSRTKDRFQQSEEPWIEGLEQYLSEIVQRRIDHVEQWLSQNVARFSENHPSIQALKRTANTTYIDLKANTKVCALKCADCHLSCLQGRHHEGRHHCGTSHTCIHECEFDDHSDESDSTCGLSAGHPGRHVCDVTAHLCGKACRLDDKPGCLRGCSKVVDHADSEHMCSATVHECGEPCSLVNVRLHNGRPFTCLERCRIPSHEPHDLHVCAHRECPIQCQLCKRLCSCPYHLHALQEGAVHLCGQSHPCSASCSAPGICQIETAPQSVEATFTGQHETFQYTKYTQDAKRLSCVMSIPAGEIKHPGPHLHSLDDDPFHFCETRCENCGYFCTLRLGHSQQEHDTSHGSMSRTQWTVDGPDGTALELNGRKFGTNDDGAPMLCSLLCRSMGRHVHIDFCRTDPADRCEGPEHEHITARMQPQPERPKDWVSHSLYWRRTGFKDPYPHSDQNNFALCDAMCPGPEHTTAINGTAQPSFCMLPILHPRQTLDQAPPAGGYISQDGHAFVCRNPAVMQQAFHVIFAIDRSSSMTATDRRPLRDRPNSNLIRRGHDNRLGAVYSSLHAFWSARHAAVTTGGSGGGLRRDAYTVLLFDHTVSSCLVHDFSSTPDQLLAAVLRYPSGGGTDFTAAIQNVQLLMEQHWSTERSPVIIFLSDGECSIADATVQNLCLRSTALGKPLSFHAVSFGPRSAILQRMAQIAVDVQNRTPPDPAHPVPQSAYAEALDSVHLAETFLGIAESLRKPRGSLMRT
ncbi:hypothetical protein OBBRIDRAFT_792770 [Obba rivulosa]|uniref:VWFA domain-containing protein n=1 Tax=Obba rivulosa TaxID=1052685 RepID=A0A8E2DNQ9_9APHY|nr:hypothetical protein OBBRIDRAFT_792770 [Obba rivulosa]